MTLDELRAFLDLAESRGVPGELDVRVAILGQPGVYAILITDIRNRSTGSALLGIERIRTWGDPPAPAPFDDTAPAVFKYVPSAAAVELHDALGIPLPGE